MTKSRINIAFITGRSRHDNLALSAVQRDFLRYLSDEGMTTTPVNFPWIPQSALWRETDLLRASLNNARDYIFSRRSVFAERYQKLAITMLQASDHTLLLSGSCGLEIFNNLQLPSSVLSRVSIFAYGPVARKRPQCRHLLVQGRKDIISRVWFCKVDEKIDCGHMNYLTQPELGDICRRFIEQIRE